MDTRHLQSLEEVWSLLDSVGSSIFSVVFIKRTTGEVRHMVARRGVKKYLKGGTLAYDPRPRGLLPVFDMQKGDYRMVSVDSLLEVHFKGTCWLTPLGSSQDDCHP